MAIRHLDVERRINITSHLAAHVRGTTYLLSIKGFEIRVPPEKFGMFTKVFHEALEGVLRDGKAKAENEATEIVKSA